MTRRWTRRAGFFLGGACLTLLLGCSGGPAPIPVTGTVTLEDEPLADARVQFIPQGDTPGQGGDGLTNETGRYEITPFHNRKLKGLPPGTYKVVLTKLRRSDGSPLPPEASAAESGATDSVPEPFCNPANTPFKNIVVEPVEKLFDFPLLSGKKR